MNDSDLVSRVFSEQGSALCCVPVVLGRPLGDVGTPHCVCVCACAYVCVRVCVHACVCD